MSSAGPFRWHRSLFLGSSAVLLVAAIVAAREVMLPFVLAVLIAYVLTPLVAFVERWRLRRGLAILIVYVVVLGSLAGFVRGVSPRIALEFRNLQSELPALAAEARDKWVPALTERLRAAGLAPPESPNAEGPGESAAFVVHPQADGSFAIDVGTG